jgi:hypothetical protein
VLTKGVVRGRDLAQPIRPDEVLRSLGHTQTGSVLTPEVMKWNAAEEMLRVAHDT